jgi:molybdate transport system substrate-binding protein
MTALRKVRLLYRGRRNALAKHSTRLFVATTLAISASGMAVPACMATETIEIYAAGSLRATVESLAKKAGPVLDIDVKPTFYSSGTLRQRIENGESPDLFLSADMDSPRKLADKGRTIVPAIAFARNRMCLVTKRSAGVTPENLVDRMLVKGNRIRASAPIEDPAGDYAVTIFDRIDVQHPGAGKMLRDAAQSLREALSATPRASAASLFQSNQIDMAISYCSGASAIEKEAPDLTTIAFPPELEPQPVDGIAVLSNKPGALRLALYLLSEKGQAIVSQEGLLPILDNSH